MNTSLRLPVTDGSMAGEARRTATTWAQARGYSPAFIGTMALVVTELAKNLAIHTRGGVLLLRDLSTGGNSGVEVLSLDSGPGVANFSECLRDGHSTAGTSGIGLGAVRRASHVFDVHSQAGIGTALRSELWVRPPDSKAATFTWGGASVPYTGEEVCGDTWAAQELPAGKCRLIVADGLGHGPFAADASRQAIAVFQKGNEHPLPRLMDTIHGALRSTRGAAIAIAEIDLPKRQLSYIGIGNIAASILNDTRSNSLISHNGTVGVQYRTLKEFTYPWAAASMLVMQSDGIKSQWQLDRYPGLFGKAPGLIAGVLFRDYNRPTDDSTVVVVRSSIA